MAAAPPDDWWQVRYHTAAAASVHDGMPGEAAGAAYVEAPDAATARARVAAAKNIPASQIDGVSGPMSPHAKDMAVGGNPVTGAAHAIGGVTDFLGRLASPHTWLRVAEAVIGLAFLVIALNHLLGNPAGKTAGTIAKAVPA